MKKLGIGMATVAVALLAAGLFFPALHCDGKVILRFRFHISESGSTRPVNDASIQIIPDSQFQDPLETNLASPWGGKTDSAGNSLVILGCGAGWTQTLFGKTGRHHIRHHLLIEANGYHPLSTALTNVIGGASFPISKRVFDVDLALAPNP